MELQEGIKMLRAELGMTQMEFADEMKVSFTAVNRWENAKARPNRRAAMTMLHIAKDKRVSGICLDCLNRELFLPRADRRTQLGNAKVVSEKMKLEQREYLTSEQLKLVIDSINIAVVGVRAYDDSVKDMDVFYCNQYLADMLGYSMETFKKAYTKNSLSFICKEDVPRYESHMKEVIQAKGTPPKFEEQICLVCSDGTHKKVSVKLISVQEFSYGKEMFATCKEI